MFLDYGKLTLNLSLICQSEARLISKNAEDRARGMLFLGALFISANIHSANLYFEQESRNNA